MPRDVDVELFFDPICPFAWVTSRWVVDVAAQRDLEVGWRFICLRIVNEDTDYARFPPAYPALHGLGHDLLRVAAAVRDEAGGAAVGAFYTAAGERLHPGGVTGALWRGEPVPDDLAAAVLVDAGLDPELASAVGDDHHDQVLRAETELALGRTGPDVGTPILTFDPGRDGEASFFGPVISRAPTGDEALELWDAVRSLARLRGFAELKRSLRDPLEL